MDDLPTVASLIDALQTYPADSPVRIDTADVTWTALQVMTIDGPLDVWSGYSEDAPTLYSEHEGLTP